MIKAKNSVFIIIVAMQILYLGLALIKNYSPIPSSDMWDGYIGFMDKLSVGQLSAWWEQHNEHRILLARLFFWVDISWFHGNGLFLMFSNVLALACTTFMLIWWSRGLLKNDHEQQLNRFLVYSCIIVVCSSWIQHENFSWGFQIQFILAQLLPLISFYFMSIFAGHSKSHKYIYLSYFGGVLSLLTMGNGVLVLPLLLIQMLFLKLPPKALVSFGIASLPPIFLYFFDYHAVAGHDSIVRVLRENPLGLLEYTAIYFGGPISHLYYLEEWKLIVSGVFGTLFIFLAAYKLLPLFKGRLSPLYLGLLIFLGYLAISAIGTGGGRLKFGLDQALSSRYQTPVLLAWVALALLYLPEISRMKRKSFFLLPIIVLNAAFLSYNSSGARHPNSNLDSKDLAMVALNLGVFDRNVLATVYPSPEFLFERFSRSSSPTFSKLGGYLPNGMYQDLKNSHLNLEQRCNLPITDLTSERVDKNSFSISAVVDSEVAEYINASYFLAVNEGHLVGAITQIQDDTSIFKKTTNRYHGYIKVSDSETLNHLSWLCTAPNLN